MSKKFVVISDDLTGANGIAGFMSHFCNTIVINYDNDFITDIINNVNVPSYDCVVINTKSRMIDGDEARSRVDYVLKLFNDKKYRFGKRIDSALRGNIENEILPFIERGHTIIITDTIPEYGRYTHGGYTIINNVKSDISSKFNKITPVIIDNIDELISIRSAIDKKLFIIGSKTHDDLKRIANFIVSYEDLIPVDPLYLIAYTAQQYIGNVSYSKIWKLPFIRRIIYVIGSTQEMTIRQINYARDHGFYVLNIRDLIRLNYIIDNNWVVVYFDYMKDKELLTKDFVRFLVGFDALVLSGGETANMVFELSGGLFIESITDIMPLIGVGIIRGGMLDGKLIVTKGGFIGREDTYITIRDFLLNLNGVKV